MTVANAAAEEVPAMLAEYWGLMLKVRLEPMFSASQGRPGPTGKHDRSRASNFCMRSSSMNLCPGLIRSPFAWSRLEKEDGFSLGGNRT